MNSARIFASRNHIIEWINSVLQIQMSKIEQLGSGVIYCLLLDCGYPERVPIQKLKWYANNEVDYIYNYKILQNSFSHLGIEKKIEISKLIKAKYQDNLDFIQWLKWFLEPKIDYKQYDPIKRRDNRQVYLDFYQHKILKIPLDNICKERGSAHNHKQRQSFKKVGVNKSQNGIIQKAYAFGKNNHFLEIYDCRTDQGDYEVNIIQEKCFSRQKPKLSKTSHNFRSEHPSILILDQHLTKNLEQSTQDNKENTSLSINNTLQSANESQTNFQCMYSSPKQIKKFFFPERFSERLKRRVDVINELRKSEMKRKQESEEEKDKNLSYDKKKYLVKNDIFFYEEDSDCDVKELKV